VLVELRKAWRDWFDPTTAPGSHYVMQRAGSMFTEILNFPTGFTSPFEVFSGGVDFGSFGPGAQLISRAVAYPSSLSPGSNRW
jgi:hypothetical protein